MSIVYDFPAINRALTGLTGEPQAKPRHRICHQCFYSLGELTAPTAVTCKHCGETNYVED